MKCKTDYKCLKYPELNSAGISMWCVSLCVCVCVCAVSYTHLDVYKRQFQLFLQQTYNFTDTLVKDVLWQYKHSG